MWAVSSLENKSKVRHAGGEDRRNGISTSPETGIPLGSPASPALLRLFTEPLIEECPIIKSKMQVGRFANDVQMLAWRKSIVKPAHELRET